VNNLVTVLADMDIMPIEIGEYLHTLGAPELHSLLESSSRMKYESSKVSNQ
jgi:hypothetical protein